MRRYRTVSDVQPPASTLEGAPPSTAPPGKHSGKIHEHPVDGSGWHTGDTAVPSHSISMSGAGPQSLDVHDVVGHEGMIQPHPLSGSIPHTGVTTAPPGQLSTTGGSGPHSAVVQGPVGQGGNTQPHTFSAVTPHVGPTVVPPGQASATVGTAAPHELAVQTGEPPSPTQAHSAWSHWALLGHGSGLQSSLPEPPVSLPMMT